MKYMVGETERTVEWATIYVGNPQYVYRLGR